MDIVIPIKLLLSIFNEGLSAIVDIQKAKVAMFTKTQTLSPDSAAAAMPGMDHHPSDKRETTKVKEKGEEARTPQVIKFSSDTLMPSTPIAVNKGNGAMKVSDF